MTGGGRRETEQPLIAVTGATGLIGSALCSRLRADGASLALLVRSPEKLSDVPDGDRVERWDGTVGPPSPAFFEGVDGVVHLAGAGIADRRWTSARKELLRRSRIDATRHLVDAISRSSTPPPALISGSAVGYYGDGGDRTLTEAAGPGEGFLGSLASDWEAAALAARTHGCRVVLLRTGVVLSGEGGALPEMIRPFRFFVGGPLGDGAQFLSWIHIADEVGLVRHALREPSVEGPFNAVAPQPVRQGEFARRLGNILRRPAFIRTPAWALRLALGEMAGPLLLEGQRVVPERALETGYEFRFPALEDALKDILQSRRNG